MYPIGHAIANETELAPLTSIDYAISYRNVPLLRFHEASLALRKKSMKYYIDGMQINTSPGRIL